MRAAHESDPEDDCPVCPTSDMLLRDEKVQLAVGVDVDGAACGVSVGVGSVAKCSCGVKMEPEAGMVDEDAASSWSKRSLSRLIVSST